MSGMGEGSYEESTVLLEDNLYKILILLIYFPAAGGIRLAPHTFEPHFVPALSVTHKMSPFPFIHRNKIFAKIICCFSLAFTSIWICGISYWDFLHKTAILGPRASASALGTMALAFKSVVWAESGPWDPQEGERKESMALPPNLHRGSAMPFTYPWHIQ